MDNCDVTTNIWRQITAFASKTNFIRWMSIIDRRLSVLPWADFSSTKETTLHLQLLEDIDPIKDAAICHIAFIHLGSDNDATHFFMA
ncbi:hypothetical protein [Nitrosomonas aestuarii]|uniref:hypothetical protein n=1 Tax=Nitrosomonas aestuarii TaxID=52441 RepID=UPI000D2FFF13|nr:hypothetical protein [Nitrosomonas aestuarii]PTN12147.1 hypothetical protein C8R11_105109 [Nitrosomonas aestuarii]